MSLFPFYSDFKKIGDINDLNATGSIGETSAPSNLRVQKLDEFDEGEALIY